VSAFSLDEQGFCWYCRAGMIQFDAAYCFGSYDGPLRELIHLFKYGGVKTLAGPLSQLLLQLLPLGERFDMVMAMPMHWRKRWLRGFNQADLLAKPVAKRIGVPLCHNLRRNRYTPAQASLSEAQRRQNPLHTFAVRKSEQIRGKRVLLIDDVFTTGATVRAAAAALKAAGAAHVSVLTLARVDRKETIAEFSVPRKVTPQAAGVLS
jgi:competence protein ComFC